MNMEQKIKIGLICLVLICIVVIGVKLFSQNQTISTDIKQCINELESKNYDYVSGSIIICFDEKFSEKEIREIINKYNLNVMEYWSINNCVHAEVPTGSEFEWICKLKQDERVKSTELNLKSKIPEKPIQPPEQDSIEDNSKYCITSNDCVPVGCVCHCSGCGGFSYEDIVNKNCVDKWYEDHNCSPPRICPMVCCKSTTIVCENNTCKVKP